MKWIKLGNHKWVCDEGYRIARYWTFGMGSKTIFFLVFESEENYQSGINIANVSSLREAKEFCKNLEKAVDMVSV